MEIKKDMTNSALITTMFQAGAHFGFSKARRHPSVKPYIFGVKNKVEIFDLEKTEVLLEAAKEYMRGFGKEDKQVLFVGGKAEARATVKSAAQSIGMPYVSGRWIGGTITNFVQVKKRVDLLAQLMSQREKGELAKYTKKERLLLDRKIDNLNFYFSGISNMKDLPKALFVIDPKKEKIAVTEAQKFGIPVIALGGSDCNLKEVDYPIVGNDTSVSSIKFFLSEITKAYTEGKSMKPKA